MKKTDIFLTVFFIFFGILTRTIFHIGANIEFITAISLISGYFFKDKKLSFLTTFLTLAVSDTIIGNSIIFIFTWSGFFAGNFFGILLSKVTKKTGVFKLLLATEISGIASTILFYLWTNFGVVVTTNAYTKDLAGLMLSYFNGLAFLRPQLIANLILVPATFTAVYLGLRFMHKEGVLKLNNLNHR